MKAYERQALLERVERDSATVGASIPERLELEGRTVSLRDRILALQRADALGPAQESERDELLVALRRKRTELLDRLEHGDIDHSTGEALASAIIDIDRARAALRSAGDDVDIEEEIREQRVADAERWRSFIKQSRRGIERSLDR